MKTLQSIETIGSDGQIHLHIPAGRSGEEVLVLVVLSKPGESSDQLDWPRFVEAMAGSCPDLQAPPDPPPAPPRGAL